MDSLAAFLPLDRRHALANHDTLPVVQSGSVLFADISGFTPLTAVLAQELGPHRGAELLTQQLDRVFTALIDLVHQYQGVIIAFSGDAITCWFAPLSQDSPSPAQRALACGLQLQTIMAQFKALTTPKGTSIPLALKVAVAAGSIRRFLVGDPEYGLLEVVAGNTLDQMAAAEKQAGQGEVVVTAALLQQLTIQPLITDWRTTETGQQVAVVSGLVSAIPPPPAHPPALIDEETARPWLLPPVYKRLRQGPNEFLAELRPTVALFLKFSGIDYDNDPEAVAQLDQFVRQVQATLHRYDGFLIQVSLGDKGSYLYAVFGAPIAHEDDANRAVSSSLALRQLAQQLDFLQVFQMGLSSGLAYSGAYGSPLRRAYGVIGNHVNLAARLMVTADPGQILLSEAVAKTVTNTFDLLSLPPVLLKGMAEPMPVWAVQGRHLQAPAPLAERSLNPLVGREAEREQLQTALDQLAQGRSTTLLIEGQAGIGKSRLIQELLHLAGQEEGEETAVVLLGHGDAVEQSTPYHAWRFIFERIFDLEPYVLSDDPDAAWQEHLLAQLNPEQRRLAPLLNSVLPLNLPDTPLTAQMTGEARQENTHRLLVELLQMALSQPTSETGGTAGKPLLLIMEDAHWLDSVSWTLLRRVQRVIRPLLLVLAARPFNRLAPAVYQDLSELPTTTSLTLDMLPQAAVNQLVCQRLGVRRLPSLVANLIQAKAAGHPFFSEEIAYALRDAGLIEIEAGQCRVAASVTDLNRINFPNTIQGVITNRVDLLSPPQQLTVKVASVIGRVFAFRVLHDIYPAPTTPIEIQHNLEQLRRLDITPLETPEPNLSYIFKHIVTQEVVYDLMTYSQRQQLHHRTAVWYEQGQEQQSQRYDALLAHHWHQAGDIERAIYYYDRAGSQAFRSYANQEAIRFLTQAVNLSAETHPAAQHARWQRFLGEATYRLTLVEQSRDHYREALALLGYPLSDSKPRLVWGLLRELTRQLVYRWLPGHFPRPVRDEEQRANLLEAARAYEGISEIYYNIGDFLTTFYGVMAAFNLAEKAGNSPELVRGYANMCSTVGIVGWHGVAEKYRQRALQTAAAIDDLPAKAWVQIPLASYSLWLGAWERAEEEVKEALAICEQLGDWRRWCVAAWVQAQVAQSQGALAPARDLWAEVYKVAQQSQDTRHQVRALGGQFFNDLALNRSADAFACVEAAGIILEENPEMMPIEERLWLAMQAVQVLHREEWAEAKRLAQEQIAAVGRASAKFDLLEVFASSAYVLLALWEKGEASAKEAWYGCKILKQYARTYPFAQPRSLRYQARYAWLSGKRRKAEKLWAKSLAQAEALAMVQEAALTRQDMVEQAFTAF
jgi:class 3 adenylate cyclase/tetratricopeptide (TPR) repeat protein